MCVVVVVVQNILGFANTHTHRETHREKNGVVAKKKCEGISNDARPFGSAATPSTDRNSRPYRHPVQLFKLLPVCPMSPPLALQTEKGRPNGTFPPFGRKWNRQRNAALAHRNGRKN